MIKIRSISDADLSAVAILFDAYRQFYEQQSDVEFAAKFLKERIQNQQSVILVAHNSEQRVVGFCQLYPTFCSVIAQPIYVLYDLFVSSEARRLGVAKALLQAAHQQGIVDKKARLDLSTAKTNYAAQALYESLGWVRDNDFFTYSLALN